MARRSAPGHARSRRRYGAVVFAIILFPWLFALFMSVHDWHIDGERSFAGLRNYGRMLTDERLGWALLRTPYFTALPLILPMVLGVAAAVVFHRRFLGRSLARTLFIMPMMATPVAVALVWTMMFHPQLGVLKAFDTIFVISNNEPSTASENLNILLYLQAFNFYDMGYASATVAVFFVLILLITILLLHFRQRYALS